MEERQVKEAMDRAQIEAAREDLRDKLSSAKSRHRQLSYAAALPGGDEQAMDAAADAVRRIEQKLDGLNFGLEQATAEERERREAEHLVRRRKAAVDILSLVYQRQWEAEALDEALEAVECAIEGVERLGQDIKAITGGHFPDSLQGEQNLRNFMLNIGNLDMTDIAIRVRDRIGRPQRYASGLPFTRATALKALATVLPEVLDPAVQQEALALARQESEPEKQPARKPRRKAA